MPLLAAGGLLAAISYISGHPAPVGAQPRPGAAIETLVAEMDSTIPGRLRAYGVAGVSIAVLRRGRIVWMKAYGVADRETGRAMRVDNIFRVESISKSVTAWGVMRLIERKQVEPDMPVTAYLQDWSWPPSRFAADTITIRQLLSHRAGLPLGDFTSRYPPAGPVPDLRDTLRREARPIRPPGSGFAYSNTGFNLLELIVETVSGMRFSDYMAREILVPLGMADASFDWSSGIGERLPVAYDLRGDPVAPYVYPGRGSGGLFATVQDIARFVQAGMAEPYRPAHRVLSPVGMNRLYTPQARPGGLLGQAADAYGMGVFLEQLPEGRLGVWNGGQGAGWMAHFHSVPETGDGIVILTNSQRAWPLFALTLRDWSRWAGIGPVGMARLAWLILAIEILIGLAILACIVQFLRIGRGLAVGKRTFAPLAGSRPAVRLMQALLAAFLAGVLIWERSQDYLFVRSVLPHAIGWLEFAVLAAAVSFALTAALPRRGDAHRRVPGSG